LRNNYVASVSSMPRQIGTFTTNPIQFRIRDTNTVYFINTTIKKYTYSSGVYSLQAPGAVL
jgi:hypothetical protein